MVQQYYIKRNMSPICPVESFDFRITAVKFATNIGPMLLASVYMLVDYGDMESYVDVCSKLTAMYVDCDAIHFVVIGDFNCQPGSRFFEYYLQFAADNNMKRSDINRLTDVCTYYSDSGVHRS